MCGICGLISRPVNGHVATDLAAMAETIAHRGPDDRGFFVDDAVGVGLGHNRLSIIDLSSAGHQPMVAEGRKVVLTYNGEIYNFRELRSVLEDRGHVFRSETDSEVVLNSYLEWGESCVERFAGMFAFALWDAPAQKLFLARDPLGMKPLYYWSRPDTREFVFASEIKAFLALPSFKATIDRSALRQYLEFGYVFDSRQTSLSDVNKLPPGCALTVRDGLVGEPVQYFRPDVSQSAGQPSWTEREEELFETLGKVVDEHLNADVGVGLLLSGGLDSSLIAATASRRTRVTTIAMGFAASRVNELPMARAVAEHLGSDHHEVMIDAVEVRQGLESIVWYFDDLFADWGTVSTRLLYERCRRMGIKVVLVGEGSDELWAGYPIFRRAVESRGPMEFRLFDLYRRYAGRRFGSTWPKYRAIMRRLLIESGGQLPEAVRRFEVLHQLPNNYVMKVDKASMAVSVEARAPFLDRRLAILALRTPVRDLLAGGSDKRLLRTTAERFRLLPREMAQRPKFGGSIAASWMDESPEFRAYARRVILANDGWVDELDLRRPMIKYFDRGRAGYPFPHPLSILQGVAWRLLLLNLWSRRYGLMPS
jgi:asparagine synthase (glutamine-hydrolysing)